MIDPEIGRANPKIEWQINFAPFAELLRMVSREQIHFTGKCMTKLMNLSVTELEQVMRALGPMDSQHRIDRFEPFLRLLRIDVVAPSREQREWFCGRHTTLYSNRPWSEASENAGRFLLGCGPATRPADGAVPQRALMIGVRRNPVKAKSF